MLYLLIASLVVWSLILLLPWKPWQTNESFEATSDAGASANLSDITIVIPARNEADVIGQTLASLPNQGFGLQIIVVNDHSTDKTEQVVLASEVSNLNLVQSAELPQGWTGKVWAQHQGLQHVKTPLVLLLDADIKLFPGVLCSLKTRLLESDIDFISLMAKLRFSAGWEKLLVPAFIFFFKMLYPFALSNDPNSPIAAAAGGFILLKTDILSSNNGMSSIKDCLIDDCALAKMVKQKGYKTWIGITNSVISIRPYQSLAEIWNMVARTAYTQLKYSVILLVICTFLMFLLFLLPVLGLADGNIAVQAVSFLIYSVMMFCYAPILDFYGLSKVWCIFMPFIACLYLLMVWTSAYKYWRGEKSNWKGRTYQTA